MEPLPARQRDQQPQRQRWPLGARVGRHPAARAPRPGGLLRDGGRLRPDGARRGRAGRLRPQLRHLRRPSGTGRVEPVRRRGRDRAGRGGAGDPPARSVSGSIPAGSARAWPPTSSPASCSPAARRARASTSAATCGWPAKRPTPEAGGSTSTTPAAARRWPSIELARRRRRHSSRLRRQLGRPRRRGSPSPDRPAHRHERVDHRAGHARWWPPTPGGPRCWPRRRSWPTALGCPCSSTSAWPPWCSPPTACAPPRRGPPSPSRPSWRPCHDQPALVVQRPRRRHRGVGAAHRVGHLGAHALHEAPATAGAPGMDARPPPVPRRAGGDLHRRARRVDHARLVHQLRPGRRARTVRLVVAPRRRRLGDRGRLPAGRRRADVARPPPPARTAGGAGSTSCRCRCSSSRRSTSWWREPTLSSLPAVAAITAGTLAVVALVAARLWRLQRPRPTRADRDRRDQRGSSRRPRPPHRRSPSWSAPAERRGRRMRPGPFDGRPWRTDV